MALKLLAKQTQFTPLDSGRNSWLVRTPHGVPAEALLDPNFWSNCARELKPGERVEVVAQDASYDLDLRILEIGPTAERPLWVRVRVLRSWPDISLVGAAAAPSLRPQITTSVDDVVVEWGGPSHKYRLVRASDKSVLAHGFASKADAEAQLAREAA